MSNSSTKQAITSLLTEHLRYTPLTLLDDIINTVNDLVFRAVTAIEQGLNEASGAQLGFADKAAAENRTPEKDATNNDIFPEAKLEIEIGVHQLETLLEATVDKNFDKLEIYVLRNILSVPEDIAPWVRLSHYENLDITRPTTLATPETLFRLRRKAQESAKLHNALVAESARNIALIDQLRSILHADPQASNHDGRNPSLAFLTSTLGAKVLGVEYPSDPTASPKQQREQQQQQQQPLTTHTKLALEQLPALRSLLAQLRSHLATLQAGGVALRRKPAEEERRDYLESRTRRVLEQGGVDVESGEGLVGHGLRRLDSDEVRGIEGVADALHGREDGR